MTFLNPFVLFGLAAAAIPILIHLFNIRKLRTIEFSTLTFLKELNRNKIRKIKIRQWLLLVLRTLLILLIVLAFSRPALKGSYGSAGSRASSTLVILLDNTASMQLHNGKGTFLSQAQQRALEILSTLQENDDLYFLRLSDIPQATTEEPTRDIATLTSRIRDTEISEHYRTIEDGMRLASRLLKQSKNFNKEVYILTDGQLTSLSDVSEQRSSGEKLFTPNIRIFHTQFSQRQSENVAIEKTSIPPSLLQVNKPFTLNVVVKNYGTTPVKNHLVTITLDNTKVMQKSVSLDGGESATVEFSLTPYRSGFLGGYAESEDDAFESDNRDYFTVNIPESISIALVTPEEKYSRYIATALEAARTANISSPLSVTKIAPAQITSSLLSGTDVLILSGVKELSSSQSEIVKRYIANGGTAIFFPSADTTSVSYRYLSLFGVDNLTLSRSVTTFDKVDLQFPVFQGMFEEGLQKKNVSVESPRISISLNTALESNLRSIITLSNGKNFLWQKQIGSGKLLGMAVPATNEWSDLPLKGIFVPLLYQSVLYLASPINIGNTQKIFVGEKIEFSSSDLKNGTNASFSSLQFFDPENRDIPLKTYVKTSTEGISHTIFTVDQSEQAGVYFGKEKNDTVISLPVNVRREESHTELSDSKTIDEMLERLGIEPSSFTELQPDTDIVQTISESRFGIELWRYMLIAAALVALFEMFIAREPKEVVETK